MTPPLSIRLVGDPERVRQSHARGIEELQASPYTRAVVIRDVVLMPGIETPIPHGLGVAPRFVRPSAVRSASALTPGIIIEYRGTFPTGGAPIDSTQIVVLAAFSYSNPITVDVEVVP